MGNGPTKEEKQIAEIAVKETKLECPVLVDLSHGTIRHRHEEIVREDEKSKQVKIGYFYHPRMNDFSEDATMTYEDNNRLKYVFKGPIKDSGKKLYYIYGTKASDVDKGLAKTNYKPQGKGYNWPQSYRKANNLYYDVFFPEPDEAEDEEHNEGDGRPFSASDIDESLSSTSGTMLNGAIDKENINLKVLITETVLDVIERISLQLLVPSTNIHFMMNKEELNMNDHLVNHLPEDRKVTSRIFKINLRLT
jgi:hypothetical protein